jgi:hypothetical protein
MVIIFYALFLKHAWQNKYFFAKILIEAMRIHPQYEPYQKTVILIML